MTGQREQIDGAAADGARSLAAALAESEARFRDFYRRAPVPIHSIGPDRLLLDVSDEWVAFTGYARERVLGRSFAELLEPESAARYRDRAVPELLNDVPPGETRSVEYRLVKASGEVADVVLTARPERDPATGRFLRSLSVLTDVTARNRAETALRQTQKLDALGQLTGGVAHDFNNLLMAILGNLDLLRARLPADDGRAMRLLENAMQGAARGASLTRRLLAFARHQQLNPETVDCAALIEDLSEMLSPALGPTVRLERDVPPGTWRLHVDADQFGLALVNLAVNARDAMPDGGQFRIVARNRTVGAEPDPAHPSLAPGDYVLIAVTDTGIGMDAATLARSTEPFFTTKGIGRGTGLGLSMAHGFAAQSGGALRLASRLGRGTTVELWLPRAAADVAASRLPAPADLAPPPGGGLRILLVDDDALVRAGTAFMLEDLGHVVLEEAASGAEALAALDRHPDAGLLLTDYAMPGMNGLDLILRVRSLRPTLPVLLATGYADTGQPEMRDVPKLPKPYRLEELRRALDAAAERMAVDAAR